MDVQPILLPEMVTLEDRLRRAWPDFVDAAIGTYQAARQAKLDAVLTEPFDWKAHLTAMRLGTKVAYAKRFLKNIGCGMTDPMWRARGWVVGFHRFSHGRLVSVFWKQRDEFPGKVLECNLAPVGPNLRFCGD